MFWGYFEKPLQRSTPERTVFEDWSRNNLLSCFGIPVASIRAIRWRCDDLRIISSLLCANYRPCLHANPAQRRLN